MVVAAAATKKAAAAPAAVAAKAKAKTTTLKAGVVKFGKRKKKTTKTTKAKPLFIEKPIGGKQNGEKRMVRTRKLPQTYPLVPRKRLINRRRPAEKLGKIKTRPSIAPGVIVILLAGIHKAKRVVVLKVLRSGLLLVTGPFKLNGCPMRRVNQKYVIATSTRIELPTIDDKFNDKYFRRLKPGLDAATATSAAIGKSRRRSTTAYLKAKKAASATSEGALSLASESSKTEYVASAQRKADQAVVDKLVLQAIKARKDDASAMRGYLRTKFGLSKGQYPHLMKF